MDDVLIFADTLRSPELRHELPLAIMDPFLYAEHDGRAYCVVSSLEATSLHAARPEAEVLEPESFGLDELFAAGATWEEAEEEVAVRAVRQLGIARAAVPATFPIAIADRLRAAGVELVVDQQRFIDRRRRKTDAELAGIRRASRAADAAMAAIAALLADAEPGPGDVLVLDGEPLTCERLRAAAEAAAREHGAVLDESIVAAGAQGALGHHPGSGPVHAGEGVLCDLWPQDRASGCFSDCTRTFTAGAAPAEELIVWHELCRDALQRVLDATAAGVTGRELWEVSCDVFEAAGHATQRTKRPGEQLDHGYFHSLGHGVGLDVHEHPALGRAGHAPLVAGDVVAIEPGTYRPGFGGVRIEDTVLVTADGHEVLTRAPYALRLG